MTYAIGDPESPIPNKPDILLHKNAGAKRGLKEGDEFWQMCPRVAGNRLIVRKIRGIWGQPDTYKQENCPVETFAAMEREIEQWKLAALEEDFQSPLSTYVGE